MTIITQIILLAGAFFVFVAALGIVRFPDLYTRMHAAAKAASFGLGLILTAAALAHGNTETTIKAILAIAFIFLTAPIASHFIARGAYHRRTPYWDGTVVDELKDGPHDPGAHAPKPEDPV
jgi:multicomponent Na+:H+ antiporter subunit G